MSRTHHGQGGEHGGRHDYAAGAAAAPGQRGAQSQDISGDAGTRPRVATLELASHLIREITYDPATKVLEVEHRLKGRRRYFDVPPAVVLNLITAPSPGWYYTQHIRDAFPRDDDGSHRHFSFPRLFSRSHHH
ncbi:MAG: KTSC domain-containing protein [Rhizobium sp.]